MYGQISSIKKKRFSKYKIHFKTHTKKKTHNTSKHNILKIEPCYAAAIVRQPSVGHVFFSSFFLGQSSFLFFLFLTDFFFFFFFFMFFAFYILMKMFWIVFWNIWVILAKFSWANIWVLMPQNSFLDSKLKPIKG
jgi:hypothetical protein